jgi:hypothetical protein
MLSPVAHAIEQIRLAFAPSAVTVDDDGSGGAYVIVEVVDLGPKFVPQHSWLGGHLTAQTPYSDVYPIYGGGELLRADGRPFQPPLSLGHQFRGRPALQISRRSNRLDPQLQTPALKFSKVLHYLRNDA